MNWPVLEISYTWNHTAYGLLNLAPFSKFNFCQVSWNMALIPALEKETEADLEFEVSLVYIASSRPARAA